MFQPRPAISAACGAAAAAAGAAARRAGVPAHRTVATANSTARKSTGKAPKKSLHAAVHQATSRATCLADIHAALAAGEDPNGLNDCGSRPLKLAAMLADEAIASAAIRALLNEGADVSMTYGCSGLTVLHEAAEYGRPGAVATVLRGCWQLAQTCRPQHARDSRPCTARRKGRRRL